MRIGIMLRHFEQHGGGVNTYTRRLLPGLFAAAPADEFVLLYPREHLKGTYARFPNVSEQVVPAASVLVWDQLKVPRAVRRLGLDLLFNPKYSIPLTVDCRTAWVCHGLDWYVMPWASPWLDRVSHRYLVPRYAAKADAIIAVSEITREHVMEFLSVPGERVHTVYSGIPDVFYESPPAPALERTRERLQLPPQFLLYAGQIYPPKNFTRLLQAYARVGPARGVALVIAGGTANVLSRHELELPERLGIARWVRWSGWLEPQELACVYRLALALLLPSLFESFGFPIVEAMASGCAVLTSNRYGTAEIAEDAALLVDPESIEEIAAGIARLVEEPLLRARLSERGRVRAAHFTLARCVSETTAVLRGTTPPAHPAPLTALPKA